MTVEGGGRTEEVGCGDGVVKEGGGGAEEYGVGVVLFRDGEDDGIRFAVVVGVVDAELVVIVVVGGGNLGPLVVEVIVYDTPIECSVIEYECAVPFFTVLLLLLLLDGPLVLLPPAGLPLLVIPRPSPLTE